MPLILLLVLTTTPNYLLPIQLNLNFGFKTTSGLSHPTLWAPGGSPLMAHCSPNRKLALVSPSVLNLQPFDSQPPPQASPASTADLCLLLITTVLTAATQFGISRCIASLPYILHFLPSPSWFCLKFDVSPFNIIFKLGVSFLDPPFCHTSNLHVDRFLVWVPIKKTTHGRPNECQILYLGITIRLIDRSRWKWNRFRAINLWKKDF